MKNSNSKCTCYEEDIKLHPCPYAEEMRGYTTEFNEPVDFCNCCDYCTHECAQDS